MKKRRYNLLYQQVPARFILIALLLTILSHTSDTEALSLEFTNYDIIDFDSMTRGAIKDEIPPDGFIIRCTAGPNTVGWDLSVKIEHPLTHESNPASIIPNTYFKWYGESTSNLTNNSLIMQQRVEFTTFDTLIYTGNVDEDQTDITLKFELTVPRDAQWGTYNTRFGDIVFTLTE